MSLSNTIKTHELEPITFTQSQVVFRIPADKIYLQNLRLANLGLTTTGTVGSNAPLSYAYNTGVFQIVKNIYLYHNNLMLAQIKGVDEWMAFQNLLYSNEENMDKVNVVVKTNMGFEFNDDKIQAPSPESVISSDNEEDQPALVSLSKVLSFLDQAGYLNTNVMRYLRLVIDFNTITPSLLNFAPQVSDSVTQGATTVITFASDASALGFAVGQTVLISGYDGNGWDAFNGSRTITAVAGANITVNVDSSGYVGANPTVQGSVMITNFNSAIALEIKRPYLLLDELINVNPAQYPFKPFKYGSVDSQSITVNANATSISQRLNAWNNKKLLRLLMVNQDNGTDTVGSHVARHATSVTKADPAVVDFGVPAAGLGFVVGQLVMGKGFTGDEWTQLNSLIGITAVAGNTITLDIDSSGFTGAAPAVVGSFIVYSNPYLGIKKYQSLGMYNEAWKFWVNGMQLVPNQGISNDALKQYYLVDAWGLSSNVNIPQGASDVRNQLNKSYLYYNSPEDNVRNENFCGNLSYGGVRVADAIGGVPVSKFDLVYTREAYPDTPASNVVRSQSTKAFTMVLYGEVEKQIGLSNGEVIVIG